MTQQLPEIVHIKALDFIAASGGNTDRVMAMQYLALLAIRGSIPAYMSEGIAGYAIDKLNYNASLAGLASREGVVSSDHIRKHLQDFFSKDKNKIINDPNDWEELQKIYESVQFKLIIKESSNKMPKTNSDMTHEVSGLDNQKDSLLMKEIKNKKKRALENGKSQEKNSESKPDNIKEEREPAIDTETKTEDNNKKSMAEAELKRRKKNFKDWGNQIG